jgi:hypothetical protein
MAYEMLDYAGYQRRQEDIDATILGALADGVGKTHVELQVLLRTECVGNAKTDDPLELCYSSTGAILRTALNSLRMRGLIYDSWDCATDNSYVKPFRYFRHTEAA